MIAEDISILSCSLTVASHHQSQQMPAGCEDPLSDVFSLIIPCVNSALLLLLLHLLPRRRCRSREDDPSSGMVRYGIHSSTRWSFLCMYHFAFFVWDACQACLLCLSFLHVNNILISSPGSLFKLWFCICASVPSLDVNKRSCGVVLLGLASSNEPS